MAPARRPSRRGLRAERWSEGVEYLNPDDIARDRFGDWNSPDAVRKAAEWTDRRREELLARGEGIAFETVFSTHGKVDFLVPIEKIVSRYTRSMANLSAAVAIADRAYVNSPDDVEAALCVRTHDAQLRKIYQALPTWIADAVSALPMHPAFVDQSAA